MSSLPVPQPWLTTVTDQASVILADNPSAMTLEGTNTWVLRAPGHPGAVVVDPGPALAEHVERQVITGPVELVLITHRHGDHTDAIDALHDRTGAPVQAYAPEHCREAEPLVGGEVLHAGGVQLQVIHAPGHTSDSLCFVLTEDTDDGAAKTLVLTGDTVLGRGTTMIDHPDGTLADYLQTLERLEVLADSPGPTMGLPGHGPVIPDLASTCRDLRAHRADRLREVRTALGALGTDATVEQLTEHIYPDVPDGVRRAAEHSVRAQLAYLNDRP